MTKELEEAYELLLRQAKKVCVDSIMFGPGSGSVAIAIRDLSEVHDAVIDAKERGRLGHEPPEGD